MPTVKVIVKGAGSLEVGGIDAKQMYKNIKATVDGYGGGVFSVREIKRGRKKKVKSEEAPSA